MLISISVQCIYVSTKGLDSQSCLSMNSSQHCKTLSYPMQHGFNTICIHGSYTLYNDTMLLDHITVDIVVLGNRASIQNSSLLINSNRFNYVTVSFVNVDFNQSSIRVINVNMYFESCSFTGTDIEDEPPAIPGHGFYHVAFANSSIICTKEQSGLSTVNMPAAYITLSNSTLYNCPISLKVQGISFHSESSSFYSCSIEITVKINLKIGSTIDLINSKFEGPDPSSVLHLSLSNPNVTVQKCTFQKTHLAIQLADPKLNQDICSLQIKATSFRQASNVLNGGAIFISFGRLTPSIVTILDSVFIENRAKSNGHGLLSGIGGAIFAEGTSMKLHIQNVTFKDNVGDKYGSALYASNGIEASIEDSHFLYNPDHVLFPPKSLVEAENQLVVIRSTLSITGSYLNIGNGFSFANIERLLTLDLLLSCPLWYRVEWDEPDSSEHGLLKKLSLQCKACPETFYTYSRGHKRLTYFGNGSDISIVSASNHSSPEKCLKCKYGGQCREGIVLSRPNYWGYTYDEELVFKQCPSGYCCSGSDTSPCISYNSCAGNKTGVLCGACQEGFSVSILTGKCMSDDKCGESLWFWFMAFGAALAYAMWYTFKDDILKFIFTVGRVLKAIKAKFASYSRTVSNSQSNKSNSQESCSDNKAKEYVDKGYFGIVTYFVQMAAVMKVSIEFDDIGNSESITDTMSGYLNQALNVEMSQFLFDSCPILGLKTTGAFIYKLLFSCSIYITWSFVYFIVLAFEYFVKIKEKEDPKLHLRDKIRQFQIKLIMGLVEIIKYTYAGICGVIFLSLACVSVAGHLVWLYDGTVKCLSEWQYVILFVLVFYAIPFPLALFLCMRLLKRGEINSGLFIFGCICPLIALFFIALQQTVNSKPEKGKGSHLSEFGMAILSVLQGPFCSDDDRMTLYWECIISIRRFLLTALTLIPIASVQMVSAVCLCMIFLLHHNYVHPFHVKTSNHVETLSLSLLVLVAVINLLKSNLTESGVVPTGPSVGFFKTLQFIENIKAFILICFIIFIEIRNRIYKKNKL